jgi:hypothetical protein
MPITLAGSVVRNHERPPFLMIHGQPKVGKTSLLASAPSPIVLAAERGLGRTDLLRNTPAIPIGQNGSNGMTDFFESCQALYDDKATTYRTIILDSADHLEPHVHKVVVDRIGDGKPFAEIGYGKGPQLAAAVWRNEILPWFDALRGVGYMIGVIAHSAAVKENPPDSVTQFTRWSLKLDKPSAAVLCEVADVIGYAALPMITTEVAGNGFAGAGQSKTTTKITGAGERRLYLAPAGGFVAGSRFRMPEYIPLDWNTLASFMTGVPEAVAAQ